MSLNQLQDFYKVTITSNTGAGAGKIYVSTKPTPTNGYIVASPTNASKREIIRYTGTGTDGGGDYVEVLDVADRGLGGTVAQVHISGESVRMNMTSEHWADLITEMMNKLSTSPDFPDTDALKAYIDGISINGGAPASTTVLGLVRMSYHSDVALGNCTITNASPAVITKATHGLTVNDIVQFSTTGSLPTGLTVGVSYYVLSSGLTTNDFQVSLVAGGTAINTSSAGSGTHSVTKVTPIAVSPNDPMLTRLPSAGEKTAISGYSGAGVGSLNKLIDYVAGTNGNIVDQSQTTQNGSVTVGEANATTKYNKLAQSFIAGKSPIASAQLHKLADTGSFTGDVTVSIQADVSGSPSGTPLATVTVTNASWLALSVGLNTFTFGTPYVPIIGNTYWLVVETTTSNNSNKINLGTNTAGGYASGSVKFNNTIDGWTTIATIDLTFYIQTNLLDKFVILDDTGKLPALDASNLTGIVLNKKNYTADGDISKNDAVFVTGNNTVKSIYPSSMTNGASISTSPTSSGANKSLPLSTLGMYLHIQGGNVSGAKALTAQVRTMNVGETDFSNGTEQIIYNTSNGVNHYDICEIGTDKFLIIFQTNTSGSGAGIKCCVLTISGNTITMGSHQTIESTGSTNVSNACMKLNTDKVCIFYKKDIDSFLYGQVLTVSGTAISTNTPYQVKNAILNSSSVSACGLAGVDSGVVTYAVQTNSNLYAKAFTVSGVVITFNSENVLTSTSSSSSYGVRIATITSTKLIICFEDRGTPQASRCATIAITGGGATLTMSSTMNMSSNQNTYGYYGIWVISSKYALVASYSSNTYYDIYLINIIGTTPVQISMETLTHSTTSGQYHGVAIVKIAPWTYVCIGGGSNSDGDFIVKLAGSFATIIGIAQSDILNSASGAILYRFLTQSLSSITFTAGSQYYIDDSGQPTLKYSLSAPILGIAINNSTILLK